MRREDMWKLINASITPVDEETSSARVASEEEVEQSTAGVVFIHTVGLMPETVNALIEQGHCVRTDISYADVVLASKAVEEERVPVLYLNPNQEDVSLYLLDNAREVIPATITKDILLDRISRYKRVQRIVDAVIVTEDPHLKRLLERELANRFETLSLYERTESFLEEHVATRPYLLVFSSALPRADGLELLLRAKTESVMPFHAIMISMYNRERDHVLAIERGVDGIMTLPLKVEEFRAWLRKLEGMNE